MMGGSLEPLEIGGSNSQLCHPVIDLRHVTDDHEPKALAVADDLRSRFVRGNARVHTLASAPAELGFAEDKARGSWEIHNDRPNSLRI